MGPETWRSTGADIAYSVESLPAPETMDGVYYDANLKRVYMTGGRWYGTPDASPGWVYVSQQKHPDQLRSDLQDQDQARFGHFALGTPSSMAFMSPLKRSVTRRPRYWYSSRCHENSSYRQASTIWASLPGRSAHCVTADDRDQVYVCDPAHGKILVFKDSLPTGQ